MAPLLPPPPTCPSGRTRAALATASLLVFGALCAAPASADITVGFVTSLSGNGSSLGIPYARGMAAALAYKSEIGGEKLTIIQLDDTSDPSAASRDARKLIEENHVDVLIGSATAPATIAMAQVATELKVPMIALSPVPIAGTTPEQWMVAVPQPASLLVKVVADRMKRDHMEKVAYIGFSDAWGDLVYAGAKAAEAEGGLTILTNERYTRSDSSVTGQALKIMATHPQAILIGGSGTQGALPLLNLAPLGFHGSAYGPASLVNQDFIRVGGKAVEGIQVSTGPVIVAEQLPDDHYARKISLAFREAYLKANGAPTSDGFSAYSFDGWLILLTAAKQALQVAKPGTPEFHAALDDAIFKIHELAGTQGVYNFTRGQNYGVDDRAVVIVRLVDGKWTYAP